MSDPLEDQAAIVRKAAVASLVAYGIMLDGALVPVEDERIDTVESDIDQIIEVYADENGATASRAGTAPAFDITLQLIVQAVVRRANKSAAVAASDAIIAQVKDALLSDGNWVKLSANLPNFRVTRSLKPETERVVGDTRILIECAWREVYPPRVVQQLGTITFTTTPPAGTVPIAAGVTLQT